jgi:hypothetical protein
LWLRCHNGSAATLCNIYHCKIFPSPPVEVLQSHGFIKKLQNHEKVSSTPSVEKQSRNNRPPLLMSHLRTKRRPIRSRTNNFHFNFKSPIHNSSPLLKGDRTSTNHRTSNLFKSNNAGGSYDLIGIEFINKGASTNPLIYHTTYATYRYRDLLGLSMQSSNCLLNCTDGKVSNIILQVMLEQKMTPCPRHSALLSRFPTDPSISHDPPSDLTPIERHLAEGIAERCALFAVNNSETGQNARDTYSAWLCWGFFDPETL